VPEQQFCKNGNGSQAGENLKRRMEETMKAKMDKGKMMPVGPMMIEHRLIERMIAVMRTELDRFVREKKANPEFIMIFVDFVRTYADRCHHGKEEDILFRELDKKELSKEHREVMEQLIEDHKWARQQTGELVDATEKYSAGDNGMFLIITARLKALTEFYPKHIEREDKHFFLPVMRYFSQEEKDAMLREGFEFDQSLIHDKYRQIVEQSERSVTP
jgi:hemerythrin-like domain-containing protein